MHQSPQRWRGGWNTVAGGLSLVLASVPVIAAVSPSWSVDDIVVSERALEFSISPDGHAVAWVLARMDEQLGAPRVDLLLTDLDTGETVQMTRDLAAESNLQWSPSGHRLSFLSTRQPLAPEDAAGQGAIAEQQLWLFDLRGGEPWRASRTERALVDYGWASDRAIVVAMSAQPEAEQGRGPTDDTISVEDPAATPPVRLFTLRLDDSALDDSALEEGALEEGALEPLTANDDWIESLFVSPDGRWTVTRHSRSLSYVFDQRVRPWIVLTDLRSGASQRLFSEHDLVLSNVSWEPDSGGFYFTTRHSTHPIYTTPSVARVWHFRLGREDATPVDLDWPRGLGQRSVHATAGGFLALLADGVRFRLAHYEKRGSGWSRHLVDDERTGAIFDVHLSGNGRTLLFSHSRPDLPVQWFSSRLEGSDLSAVRQFSDLHRKIAGKPYPRTEVVRWRGARGDEVEGILYYPLSYQEGHRYPLVLRIHGGPAGTDLLDWEQHWVNPKPLLAQQGIFQLEVNYHGSANYGLAWLESITDGGYYDLPLADLESGVDHLIERGLVDPERLATMGWSNGAILSIALVTRSRRYRAAAVGAGDVDWFGDWGNSEYGASFNGSYFGGTPWEQQARYLEQSPFFRLDEVTTPTLIHFGTEDKDVPPSQGWSHFRALQHAGKTEVRFLLYPGESHIFRGLAHQRRKVEEDLAWLRRHLLGGTDGIENGARPIDNGVEVPLD